MVDFDILQSNPALSPSSRNRIFLTSAVNWEPVSTRKISNKMKEVESVYQVINTYFKLKARPWQVGAVMDITKRKRDICAIAGINAGKSLIYQSILVITGGFVLVISPTIALMDLSWRTRFALPLRCYIIITYIWKCDFIRRTGLAVVAFTSNALAGNPSIWHRLDKGTYDIILALSEVVLRP